MLSFAPLQSHKLIYSDENSRKGAQYWASRSGCATIEADIFSQV